MLEGQAREVAWKLVNTPGLRYGEGLSSWTLKFSRVMVDVGMGQVPTS